MKKFIQFMELFIVVILMASCGSKFVWPNGKLANMIPQIEGVQGEVGYENLDSLYITLEGIGESQYLEYIQECKNRGFYIEATEGSDGFTAFDENGYKIDLSYFSLGSMWINVDAPISMNTFSWPNSNIAQLLPVPISNYGKIEQESDSGFVIFVGNTTKDEYNDYVNAVYEKGFVEDYNKGEDYFYADNSNGYSVSLKYEGFNTMFISIDEPDTENDEYEFEEAENIIEGNEDVDEFENNAELIADMRPEFKEALDSYEEFFDDYCEFMKKYADNPTDLGLLTDYTKFMKQYTETMSKLEALDDGEMNNTETKYYVEVTGRITQKLLDVSTSMEQ